MKISSQKLLPARVDRRGKISGRAVALACAVAALGTASARATVYTFTGGAGTNDYKTAGNWSPNAIPDLTTANTAQIANGSAVTYNPGGDLTIKNGGILQVTNGSFTQIVGGAYIQLNGSGTVLVDGGTFNQGTASSNPFNVTGTGNAFTISAGTANINTTFNINTGLTYSQSGGTTNVTGNETDFNGGSSLLSGGILNTKLITGVNGPAGNTFNISGGTLNLTGAGFNGIYGGGPTHYINFTPGSTGMITFTSGSTTISNVQGFVNAGVIEYNGGGTGTLSNFNITQDAGTGFVTLALANVAPVPEASTVASSLLLAAFAFWKIVLRRKRASVA